MNIIPHNFICNLFGDMSSKTEISLRVCITTHKININIINHLNKSIQYKSMLVLKNPIMFLAKVGSSWSPEAYWAHMMIGACKALEVGIIRGFFALRAEYLKFAYRIIQLLVNSLILASDSSWASYCSNWNDPIMILFYVQV